MSLRQKIKELGNPLDWSEMDRGILLMLVEMLLFIQFDLWSLVMLKAPGMAAYVNIDSLVCFRLTALVLLLVVMSLIALGLATRHRPFAQRHYPALAAQFYAVSMCFYGFLIGSMSYLAGVVMAAAPIVGFIIFEHRTVYRAVATAYVLIIGMSVASATGHLVYAPVFATNLPLNSPAGRFWLASMIFFGALLLASLVLLSDYTMRRWHQREAEVKLLSQTDVLTGISNRRHISEHLERQLALARRHGLPLSVLLMDLDHFKQVNDQHGHPAGDAVLRQTATILKGQLRESDAVGRYGGEEFMLVLSGTDPQGAEALAERCRQALEQTLMVLPGGAAVRVTGSFGVCSYSLTGAADVEALIRQADAALYTAKAEGRNGVVAAHRKKA